MPSWPAGRRSSPRSAAAPRGGVSGLAAATGLLLLLGGCRTTSRELPLPDVRQASSYTCGVAALQAVLAYYGVEVREDRLARELGADPDRGVPPEALLRVARARGLRAELREQLAVEDLAGAVRAGRPVLLALQAWADQPGTGYREKWEDGHYVVVVAVEGDQIIVEDPSLLGSRGQLSRAQLEERWHDTDGRRRYLRMGIIFDGTPAPPPARRPVE